MEPSHFRDLKLCRVSGLGWVRQQLRSLFPKRIPAHSPVQFNVQKLSLGAILRSAMRSSTQRGCVCFLRKQVLFNRNVLRVPECLALWSVVVAMVVPGYERDKVSEVIVFIGPTSVGERDKLELHRALSTSGLKGNQCVTAKELTCMARDHSRWSGQLTPLQLLPGVFWIGNFGN